MDEVPKSRKRTVRIISLPESSSLPEIETNLPDDLPTLLSNLRQILLKKSPDDNIDSNIAQYIERIIFKIQALTNLSEHKEIFDTIQAVVKIYINDLLSITNCLNILSDNSFQKIFLAVQDINNKLPLHLVFENDPLYARTVCYRSFDLLSLPVIIDFLNGKYPSELFTHISLILREIMAGIQLTIVCIVFKKNDLKDRVSILRLLIEYVDKNKENLDHNDMPLILIIFLRFLWALVDDTMLVPTIIEANCTNFVLKWVSMNNLSLDLQVPCIHIIHNLARHENGVKILNENNCVNILKEFKKRILDPNKNNDEELYKELRLLYCMILSLLTEAKENHEDLDNLRSILNQLMQLIIDAGQSPNDKYAGFHVSEPVVVLAKLCVHDEILKYVLNEAPVKNMETKSKIDFFCQLLMQFRGALASDNELDQLTLTALFNIIWSMSFHDEYIEELKLDSKFIMTVKSLANDDGEALVEQYVPQHMSSIAKAANIILWNLDENNPARTAKTAALEMKIPVLNNNVIDIRTRVMVSYCHADSEFCHQLVEALQKDNRLEVWVDFVYCHTEDFWEEIGEAIEKSHVVLLLMSKDYQDSKSCRQEVMYAKDSLKKRFIPIHMKKDFVPTGWLGVRIVGPQYIRFGKRSFDDTIKELIKLIFDDKNQQVSTDKKQTKPPSPVIDTKPIENSNNQAKPLENNQAKPLENNQTKPLENNHTKPLENKHIESDVKLPTKSIEQWTKKDIEQWFEANHIHQELIDLYGFKHGTDLLLYGQCLHPDWQIEYNDMRERYQQKYNTQLYRDQFVRFVGAIHRLESPRSNSQMCVIF